MRRSHVIVPMFALLAALAGCAADNASVYIEGNIVPEKQDLGCTVSADGALLTAGFYNVDGEWPYVIHPLYNNQLLSRASDVRADPNGVLIMGAEIELQDIAGAPLALDASLPNPFTIPASTFIHSGDVGQPGQNVGEIQAIPEPYRAWLSANTQRGTIIISVKVFGRTNGNIDIQSGAWVWPVVLCGGDCLYQCLGPDDTTEVYSCNPGQDFTSVVTCAAP